MKYSWMILAFVAGAILPVQGGLNARLGRSLENPVYASLASFLVGSIVLLSFALITQQQISWSGLRTAPVSSWIGGLLGAFFVTAVIMILPRIGPALTFSLIVAGQMIVAMLLEHYGVLDSQHNPINLMRVFGAVLVIVGVIIIRKF